MSQPVPRGLAVSVAWLALGFLTSQTPRPALRLDAAGGVAGIAFGQAAAAIPDFAAQFRKQGKPRLRTQLYGRPHDTTQLGSFGRPRSYWFRQGQFVGVDYISCKQRAPEQALQVLTARYGRPQADSLTGEVYWLGERTFILLDAPKRPGGGCTSVLIGSLAMLNELVREAAVRAQARRVLHWQPDSIGLPRQWPRR